MNLQPDLYLRVFYNYKQGKQDFNPADCGRHDPVTNKLLFVFISPAKPQLLATA